MLEQLEQQAHEWMADKVQHGSDDDVFASGYLQGHLALSLNEIEGDADVLAHLETDMADRLQQASSELAPEDLALVQASWQELLTTLRD
ncbi:YfcL family protein [Ferrimonas aestuarii]|uniref:YfcL family protein n=1 Tax=Ferrimonas aestuarii TaxID=2569539 RepID=A0A4U1BLE5_9GAMM|nr:YfcL family protein [Ferrimonas aestuarii]TKB53909.1 YfcL family protein [Ferrimonas aestuarii]